VATHSGEGSKSVSGSIPAGEGPFTALNAQSSMLNSPGGDMASAYATTDVRSQSLSSAFKPGSWENV
jgi:hypothetical protein